MTRILADLPDEDIQWLDARAAEQGKSRASVLREAVSAFKTETAADDGLGWLDEGFGAWRHRSDIGDAVEWQRRERASWTRPWDDDYEQVKQEFPELFDAEDDRQRQIYLDMVAGKDPSANKPDAW
jgi:hypothetical protein